MLSTTPPLGYANCCAAIRDMDQREPIRAITNPVLVIIGKVDPATPPAAGQLIAGSIHGAQTVELDAAHLSNLEQPTAFTKAVLDFLQA
jgi:3-oxoadipate enol-lactonase